MAHAFSADGSKQSGRITLVWVFRLLFFVLLLHDHLQQVVVPEKHNQGPEINQPYPSSTYA